MTATLTSPRLLAIPRRERLKGPLTVLAIAVVAAVLRLYNINHAYDIFGDEVNYTDLGLSIRSHHFPPQFGHQVFLLHPPMFFIASAGWEDLFRISGSYFHILYSIRTLNAIFGVATAVLLYSLGTRLAGRTAGIATALLFSFDPYILRQNGRVLLETGTLALVLAGWLILLPLYQHRARRPRLVAAGGGLMLGLALLSKDMAFALIGVPLLAAIWRGWGAGRRLSALALLTSVVPYAVYVVALAFNGQLAAFVTQEDSGLRRFLGAQKSSGFSRTGSPSLVHTLLNQIGQFGVTYLGCALGGLAALFLLTVRRDDVRVLAMVTVGGAISLAYAVLFGTIEEQFLYFLYVPALLSLVVGTSSLLRRLARARPSISWRRWIAVLLVAFVCYDFGTWVYIRTSPDNGMQRMTDWFQTNAPHDATIAHNSETSAYVLQRAGFGNELFAGAPSFMAAHHVRYLVIAQSIVNGNYTLLTAGGLPQLPGEESLDRQQVQYYASHGKEVFSFAGRTFGKVIVYETNDPSLW